MSASPGPIADQLIALLPRLRRFARALTRNALEGDDLVRAGMERALTQLDQLPLATPLELWLFAVLRKAWLDETRARRRHGEQLEADLRANPRNLSLDAAVNQLPEEHRLVVALVLVDGLAYKEAADVLNVSVDTVTNRLAHAREALEALLGGREAS